MSKYTLLVLILPGTVCTTVIASRGSAQWSYRGAEAPRNWGHLSPGYNSAPLASANHPLISETRWGAGCLNYASTTNRSHYRFLIMAIPFKLTMVSSK